MRDPENESTHPNPVDPKTDPGHGGNGGDDTPTDATPGNAFSQDFLTLFDEQDSPSHTYASLGQGPWHVRPTQDPTGTLDPQLTHWGCFAEGEDDPVEIVQDRAVALLFAAALPSVSAQWRFVNDPDRHDPAVLLDQGTPIATMRFVNEELVAMVNGHVALLEAPSAFAHLMEAAGAPVLERTGRILSRRILRDSRRRNRRGNWRPITLCGSPGATPQALLPFRSPLLPHRPRLPGGERGRRRVK